MLVLHIPNSCRDQLDRLRPVRSAAYEEDRPPSELVACLVDAAWLNAVDPHGQMGTEYGAINAGALHVERTSACGTRGRHPIFPGRSDSARKAVFMTDCGIHRNRRRSPRSR